VIGRVTLDDAVSTYPVPTERSLPYHIVTGPDGALWFTEQDANKIERIQIRGVPTAPSGAGLPRTGRTSFATWWLVGGAAGACGLGVLLRRRPVP
jgi:LPXTG-motif cell wall-anchored protein